MSSSRFPAFSASKCLQNSSIIQNNSVTLQSVVVSNIFVTNWFSTIKVQNIYETTNFFINYFLSQTGVDIKENLIFFFKHHQPESKSIRYLYVFFSEFFVRRTNENIHRFSSYKWLIRHFEWCGSRAVHIALVWNTFHL